MEKMKVGGLLEIPGLAIVSFYSDDLTPMTVSEILESCGRNGINLEYIVEAQKDGKGTLSVCVKSFDKKGVLSIAKELGKENVEVVDNVFVLAIFGPHFREKPFLAGRMFKALKDAGVNFISISTSISSCSCVVREEDVDRARKALETVFEIPTMI